MKTILSLVLLFSVQAFAASDLVPLRSSDKLAKMVTAINTKIRDENISGCGVSQAKAFAVEEEVNWDKTAKELLMETYGDDFKAKGSIEVEVVQNFEPAHVAEATDALMASNDYNPKAKDIRRQLSRTVWAMLRELGVSSKSLVISAEVDALSSCGKQNVQSFLFVNPKTKRAVHIFAAQGFM